MMGIFSRGLKGGEASSGPHTIDHAHDTQTRQRKRRQALKEATADVVREFGNSLARGPRRKIALNRMRLNWRKAYAA